jgi:hypothetical protein
MKTLESFIPLLHLLICLTTFSVLLLLVQNVYFYFLSYLLFKNELSLTPLLNLTVVITTTWLFHQLIWCKNYIYMVKTPYPISHDLRNFIFTRFYYFNTRFNYQYTIDNFYLLLYYFYLTYSINNLYIIYYNSFDNDLIHHNFYIFAVYNHVLPQPHLFMNNWMSLVRQFGQYL